MLLPLTALAADTPTSDNTIATSVALPVSGFTGTVDEAEDEDDVFRVPLVAGQWFYAGSKPGRTLDHDLYLWDPNATSVAQKSPAVAHSETDGLGLAERVLYRAPTTGTYYLDVWAYRGSGSYTLKYGFPTETASLSASGPSQTEWAASAEVTGTVRNQAGVPKSGEPVYLFAKPYGAAAFTLVASTESDASGNFRFTPVPAKRTTYRVSHLGGPRLLPAEASPELVITPRAYLTAPSAPSKVRRGEAFTTAGYLKPRHKAGGHYVKIKCYRLESGVWVSRKTLYATAYNYSSYTKYATRLSLSRGKWKIVASVTGDSQHAGKVSSPRYRTVY